MSRLGWMAACAALILCISAWVASYWQVGYGLAGDGTHLVLLRSGQLTLGWTAQPQHSGWRAAGYGGFTTLWWPRYTSFPNTFWSLGMPLWIPALLSAWWLWGTLWARDHERRWGRCPDCGYAQRGRAEAFCPECGRSFG